jgi:hypothetical protein
MREEILGTIVTAVFDIVTFILIYMLLTLSSAPKLLVILGTIIFGGVAI